MVNPVKYHLDTQGDERLIHIEPIYEEIGGGDLFPTGRYILYEAGEGVGEIRFDGELFEWDWNGCKNLDYDTIFKIVQFIREYNEPELADYLD